MGALTPGELDAGARRRRRARRLAAGLPRARRASGPRRSGARRARPRQARQRHGPARRARPRARSCELVDASPRPTSARARRRLDPLRDRRRARRRASSTSSSRGSRALAEPRARDAPGVLLCTPPTAPRRCASPASHFDMVRCGIAIYGLDPFGERPGARRASSRRWRSAPTSPTSSASSRAPAPGYGRTLARPSATPGSGCCRSATATACAAALQQRRGPGRRPPATRSSARSRWTTSPIDLGPEPDVEPGDRGGPDRRAGRRADPRRGAGAAARHDQLRGHLRDLAAGAAGVSAVSACARRGRLLGAAPAVAAAARRARRAHGRLDRRRGGARRRSSVARWSTLDLAVGRGRGEAARAIARRGRRPRLPALGRVRHLARGRARRRLARRRHPAARRRRSRPTSARRDFTVNAIAVPLGDRRRAARPDRRPAPTSRRAGCARSRRRAFADDPLRLLRAARLAAGLGLEVEPRDASRSRGPRPRAPASPPASASSPSCGARRRARTRCAGSSCSTSSGDRARSCPSSTALRGVSQNPNHHLDVHGHTLEVLAQLLELEARPRPLRRRGGREVARAARRAARRRAHPRRGAALRRAPPRHRQAATRGEQRAATSPSSATTAVGAEIVARVCKRLRTSRARCAATSRRLTLHHLRLGFLVHERPLARRRSTTTCSADRAGRAPTSPCSPSPTASPPAAAGRSPRRR